MSKWTINNPETPMLGLGDEITVDPFQPVQFAVQRVKGDGNPGIMFNSEVMGVEGITGTMTVIVHDTDETTVLAAVTQPIQETFVNLRAPEPTGGTYFVRVTFDVEEHNTNPVERLTDAIEAVLDGRSHGWATDQAAADIVSMLRADGWVKV